MRIRIRSDTMFSIQGSDFQNDASKISSIMHFRFLQLGISDFFNVASAWISEKSALTNNLDFYNVGNIFKIVITVLGKRNQIDSHFFSSM